MNFKNLLNLGTFICAIFLSTASVFAQYSGGDGSVGSPYQISNFTDLLALSNTSTDWNKHFIQTADIDAVSTQTMNVGNHDNNPNTPDVAMGWNSIGNYEFSFTGVYDGGNFTISNLYANNFTVELLGLFGYVLSGGTLKNISIINASINGSSRAGILVAEIQNGTVMNCNSSGIIESNGNSVGGLIGYTVETSVFSCSSTANVSGGLEIMGGLIGSFNIFSEMNSFDNCYATGNVTGANCNYVGGLIGNVYGAVQIVFSNCYSTGNVSGNLAVGGLFGFSQRIEMFESYALGNVNGQISVGGLIGQTSSEINISSCYATGNVSGIEEQIGGFIGAAYGSSNSMIKNCFSTGNVSGEQSVGGFCGLGGLQIENCYSVGSVTGQNTDFTGGFIGKIANNGAYSSCFWNSETANQTVGVGNGVLVGSTTAQMKTQSTFETAGWDLGEIWFLDPCSNYGYPTLYDLNVLTMTPPPTGNSEETFCFSSLVSNLLADGIDVLWYANPTGGVALPDNTVLSSATTYYASQTVNSCESAERLGVTVTIVNFSNEVTVDNFTITATATDATYKWINCSTNQIIPNAENQSFTATANGSYAVIITKNECSDTSECVTFNTIGINENQFSTLKLFPNPTSNNLSVELGETMESITISDLSGKTIKRFSVAGTSAQINIEDLTNGVYFIQISANDIISRSSFLKQ